MSQSDLIFHVAIDHKLIEKFIKELTIELKKFGSGFNIPSLICPYNQYETCSKEKTPFQLIQHLVDHCNEEVCMTQLPGRLFSPSDKCKKLSHHFLLHFSIGMGSYDHHAKYQGVFPQLQ